MYKTVMNEGLKHKERWTKGGKGKENWPYGLDEVRLPAAIMGIESMGWPFPS